MKTRTRVLLGPILGLLALAVVFIIATLVGSEVIVKVAAAVIGAILATGYVWASVRLNPTVGLIILFAALLNRPLENVLSALPLAGYLTYIDDATLALALPGALIGFIRGFVRRRHATTRRDRWTGTRANLPLMAWIGFALFALSGVIGHLIAGTNLVALPSGAWLALKLPITLFILSQLRWNRVAMRWCLLVSMAVLSIQLVIVGIEYLAPHTVHAIFGQVSGSDRGELTALKGLFEHPVQAATFGLFLTCALLGGPVSWPARAFGFLAAGIALIGIRVKTIIDVMAAGATRIFFSLPRRTRLMALAIATAVSVVGVYLAWDLVASRFSRVVLSGTSPRTLLLSTGTSLANDHAPSGSGFGTFGSETSRSMYSPVWAEYGLDDVYGFQQANPVFVTDLSWATVIGETGYLGLLGMLLALGSILWGLVRSSHAAPGTSWSLAALMFLLVIVIDSLASPRLFDGFAAAALGTLLAFRHLPARDHPFQFRPHERETTS